MKLSLFDEITADERRHSAQVTCVIMMHLSRYFRNCPCDEWTVYRSRIGTEIDLAACYGERTYWTTTKGHRVDQSS